MKMLLADYRSPGTLAPIPIHTNGEGTDALREKINEFGFGIGTMAPDLSPAEALELLAQELSLGEPYIPLLYRLPETIKTHAARYIEIRRDDVPDESGYATAPGQDMHVDGLFDELGTIMTTALYCIRPAAEGGATIIFNASAVFDELCRTDPQAAEALANPEVLIRRSPLPEVQDHRTGPGFIRMGDGSIMTRYCDGTEGEWFAARDEREALARGLEVLRAAAAKDGRYRASVQLQAHQCLIFRNDQVSHGRDPYRDTPDRRRSLMRTVYTNAAH
jgi:hypothetical protein